MSTRFRRKRGEDGEDSRDPGQPAAGGAGAEASSEADPAAGERGSGAPGAPGVSDASEDAADAEELREQRDKYLEMWQRANADYQNLRRRGLADLELASRRAKESLLHELLRVLDYLEMALATECRGEEGRNLLVGVRMTRDELVGVLEREGVRPVPDGGAFDPRLHQAVSAVETDEVEPGQVLATVRRGYVLGEHPLRHAQVQVSTAPGEAGAAPAEDLSPESEERPE